MGNFPGLRWTLRLGGKKCLYKAECFTAVLSGRSLDFPFNVFRWTEVDVHPNDVLHLNRSFFTVFSSNFYHRCRIDRAPRELGCQLTAFAARASRLWAAGIDATPAAAWQAGHSFTNNKMFRLITLP